MSQALPPSPEPDPQRLSFESIEQQLRALPPPAVPDALPAKLLAAIPPAAALPSLGSRFLKRWPWIAGGGAGLLVAALIYVGLANRSAKAPAKGGVDAARPTGSKVPASSKAIRDYEEAIRFDPYNADAWFGLAKAQAEADRPADAISSAQKALDIARSRNRTALVQTVEAWLRSYRATQPREPSR